MIKEPESRVEHIEDPESGLDVRWTDNGPKQDDPPQFRSNLANLLELDEYGLPYGYGAGDTNG
jgi:hypothetical protein